MIAPLLTALVMMLPLNPDGDQATLGDLMSRPGTTALIDDRMKTTSAAVTAWTPGDCETRFQARLADGRTAEPTIHWGSGQIVILDSFGSLSFWGLKISGERDVAGVQLTLPEPQRRQAARALRALQAACTPQR